MPNLGYIMELSRCSVRLEMPLDERRTAIGTGFFYRSGRSAFLVTAAHNLTGRHAETADLLHGVAPSLIEVALGTLEGASVRFGRTRLPLYEDGDPTLPLFAVHGVQGADVAALPVADDLLGTYHHAVNDDLDTTSAFRIDAGCDAFIIGFPEGLANAGQLPLWKRATVASDFSSRSLDFFVDTASRPGMSGAPVFARETGLITPTDARPAVAGLSPDTIFGQAFSFAGLYASRPLADETGFLAQLGRVFTIRTIEESIRKLIDEDAAERRSSNDAG